MSFRAELAEHETKSGLDAADRAHLKRWMKYFDESALKPTAWDDIAADARLIIESALYARRVAKAAQNKSNLIADASKAVHEAAKTAAECAEYLVSYYRNRDGSDFHFWRSLYKELGSMEQVIDSHEREARVLRRLIPPIDTTKIVRQGKGSNDKQSAEKKTFLNCMESWIVAILNGDDQYGRATLNKIVRRHDDVWAAIANIALDRDNITSADVKVARKPTTRRGRAGTLDR